MKITTSGIRCPCCQDTKISVLDTVLVKDIEKIYLQKLNINVHKVSGISRFQNIYFCQCEETDVRFFYPLTPGYGELYSELESSDWYYMKNKPEFNFARGYVEENFRVLEIGCGEGSWAEALSCQEYLGIELNPLAQKKAIEKGLNVTNQPLALFSTENLERFDIVCAFQVLEHVDDIRSFIESCIACLKPEGLLIYSVPSYDSFVSLAINNVLNIPPHHLSWWSDEALSNLAYIFDLELLSLHHETLSDEHRHWYCHTLVLSFLSNLFGIRFKVINTTLNFLLLSKFANWIAFLVEPIFTDKRMMPNGHSVTAIYRKRPS